MGARRRTASLRVATVATATIGLVLFLPLTSAAAAGPSGPFCAAARAFNAVRPTSRRESRAALQAFGRAAPSDARAALKTIDRAVQRGDPDAVLTQAASAQASEFDSLDQAAVTVVRDAYASCRLAVNFLAAVPTGLSDQPVGARAWSRTVCTKLVDWGEYVMSAGSSLLTPPGGVTVTLPEVQTELSNFLDTAILRTAELVHAIDEVGTPTIANGHAIASSVRDGVLHAEQTFAAAQATVRALPDDPHDFQVAAQALVQTLDDTGRSVAALMHDAELQYPVRALSAALRAEPACVGVR